MFVSITLATWVALGLIAGQPRKAEDRLQRLLDPIGARVAAESNLTKRQELFQAKVTAAANKLGQSLRPPGEAELGKIRLKLLNAGFRQEQAVAVYYGVKLICLLIALAVAFPTLVMNYGMTQKAVMYAMALGGSRFLHSRCVRGPMQEEAGRVDLPQHARCTGSHGRLRRGRARPGCGDAPGDQRAGPFLTGPVRGIRHRQLPAPDGPTRKEVLRDLGTRTGVEDVRALAAVIIQAEKFGSSIGSALRVQSDSMRLRRRQLAEEKAAKTAVKIMIPLILFIFPGVFVVLVGPAGIQMYNMMAEQKETTR